VPELVDELWTVPGDGGLAMQDWRWDLAGSIEEAPCRFRGS
jgi:hypothetical protein